MLFNSIDFLLFFPVVILIYFIIPNKIKYLWLLAASYYFYMCWDAKYALLILASTAITYASGLLIEKANKTEDSAKQKNLKKLIVVLSVISNLGILFYFKYFNFAINSVSKVFNLMHVELNMPAFDIILPVGISFYTFQALSYTIDVYRGDTKAEKNFFRYALFVSFFPQLIAGPIERSKNLLTQLANPKKFSFDNFREGILLMLWGYFLKLVMADRIAIFVDTVYGDYVSYPGVYLIIATVLFGIQIYCDFAGYSTIAMGAAKILGIKLSENFNAPYLACSVADFWRRWHISLTSWFKDYVYIPLGGNRKGKVRKYINVMIVFLLSGLWHGAGLSFVVWGALNGLFQVVGELLKPVREKAEQYLKIDKDAFGLKLAQIIGTILLIDFTWIFFRAKRMMDALGIIKSIFTTANINILHDGSLLNCGLDERNIRLLLITIVILLIADCLKNKGIVIREIILKQRYWLRCIIIVIAVLFIMIFGKYGPAYDAARFIYFQF